VRCRAERALQDDADSVRIPGGGQTTVVKLRDKDWRGQSKAPINNVKRAHHPTSILAFPLFTCTASYRISVVKSSRKPYLVAISTDKQHTSSYRNICRC
jgi:hypothetical protein